MKRTAIFTLLVSLMAPCSVPAKAQGPGAAEDGKQARAVAKKQQKTAEKLAKKQRKANIRFEKAQRKAANKAAKEAAKNANLHNR